MLKKFIMPLLFMFVLTFMAVNITGTEKFVIYDDAVTTTNDTLTSAWTYVGSSPNVAIFYNTDDTSYVKGSFEYRYGQTTAISNVAADTLSLDTRSSAVSGLSKGKVLRGYGLAADLIPGANYIRVQMIWKAGSEATTSVKVGLIAE